MGSEKKTDFRKKHPEGTVPDAGIQEAMQKHLKGDALPCAVAFQIAAEVASSPKAVGETADLVGLKISKCQLGLFGYAPEKKRVAPAQTVEAVLQDAISKALKDGNLSCRSAWEVAAGLGVSKMAVSAACEAMKIKITACQLGAF